MRPSVGSASNYGYGVMSRAEMKVIKPRASTIRALAEIEKCPTIRAFARLCAASDSPSDLEVEVNFAVRGRSTARSMPAKHQPGSVSVGHRSRGGSGRRR